MPLVVIGLVIIAIYIIFSFIITPLFELLVSNPVFFSIGLICIGGAWVVLKKTYILSSPYLRKFLLILIKWFDLFDSRIDRFLTVYLGLKSRTPEEELNKNLYSKVSKDDVKQWFYIIIFLIIFMSTAEFFNL